MISQRKTTMLCRRIIKMRIHPIGYIGLVLLAFMILANNTALAANELYIVQDGQPAGVIVIPKEADEQTRTAARWLRDYVQQSSAALLPIVTEGEDTNGTIISVGYTELSRQAGIDVSSMEWDGGRLVARDGTLFLIGHDEQPVGADWAGGAARGTSRAVVTFLEDFVGVRWFLPVPEGVRVPRKTTLFVPGDLDRSVIPAFAFIHGRYPYGFNTPAAIANNYRTAVKVLSYGGHCYYDWVPADKYFNEHPEYFAMIDGKRVKEGNHLCTSNPEVRQILLDAIRKDFDVGWDWVALGQEDGYVPCECPECEKLDHFRQIMGPSITSLKPGETTWKDYLDRFKAAPCERLAAMHLWIIDQVAQSHPGKKVHLLVYWPSLIPSAQLDNKRDNIVGEVAFYNDPYELDVMDLWKDKVHALTIMNTWFDLTSGKGTMGVMMTPSEVAQRMRAYHERGVIGLYGIHEANWGLQGPCYYVMGRVAGNPDLNDDELVREYCNGVFGTAGPTMKRFFDLLYTRSITKLGYQWQVKTFGTSEDKHLLLYPMDFLKELESILAQAERQAKAQPESVRKMIALTRQQIDLLTLLTRLIESYRAYEKSPVTEHLNTYIEALNAFNAFRHKVLTSEETYGQPWPDESDHAWLCKFLVGDGDDTNYYKSWAQRKLELDIDNLGSIAPGFSGSVILSPFSVTLPKR